ncbi:LOW QUALITY PROTEIN: odorant receptor 13a [Drosophila tropicalis]|uniref:LOW QUALITY PROTEIN: odorant receptor 13a n=1 Tax=Drosophila tropicalis TaxID=46794 RepID=UPI0035ABD56D
MFDPQPYREVRFHIPIQCVWLKMNGSWPLAVPGNSQTRFSFQRSIFAMAYTMWAWYVIMSVFITISFQTGFLISHFGDIIMTTENCCTTFMGALNLVRLLHLRLNQDKFRKIIKQFAHDIWIPDNAHVNISRDCRKRMTTFSIMTGLLSCLILMYCVLPLVELFLIVGLEAEEKPFPYKMQFPFNPYANWIKYILTYVFTSYAGICVVTTLFAEDSIFGFFVTYTCGQFRLLHERIDQLMTTSDLKCQQGYAKDDHHHWQIQELQQIAKQHNRLICFAKRLEDFFNPILLVNLLISSLLICMVGFQIITGRNMFIGDYVKFIVYISSCLSQLYILCGNGDTLIQHSTITAWHLYGCHWESTSKTQSSLRSPTNKEFRTNLQFMILCSQRPVRITAFKFSTLSLQSFTAILSTSMSYFTLLRSLYYDNSKN